MNYIHEVHSVKTKEAERLYIKKQTAAFRAKGGKIKYIGITVRA